MGPEAIPEFFSSPFGQLVGLSDRLLFASSPVRRYSFPIPRKRFFFLCFLHLPLAFAFTSALALLAVESSLDNGHLLLRTPGNS